MLRTEHFRDALAVLTETDEEVVRGSHPLVMEEVAAIAEHERLTMDEAMARAELYAREPWGDAAIRQIVWDNLCKARQQKDPNRVRNLMSLYKDTCRRHGGLCDRRTSPIRETHPILPHGAH